MGRNRPFLGVLARSSSTPAKCWGYVTHKRVEDVRAVVDSELVGDSEQQRVGGSDRLILRELLDEPLRVSGVRLAEPRLTAVDEPTWSCELPSRPK